MHLTPGVTPNDGPCRAIYKHPNIDVKTWPRGAEGSVLSDDVERVYYEKLGMSPR
jgi:hypothetical protein